MKEKRTIPRPNEVYQHFKGKQYKIITIASHTETEEELVIYQGLYAPYKVYARPVSMFLEEVDKVKYPHATQGYRFEKVEEKKSIFGKKNKSEDGLLLVEAKEEMVFETISPEEDDLQQTDTAAIHPGLLQFLDAEGYTAKLEVLSTLKNKLTPELLTPMELSMGMEPSEATVEERYASIKNQLLTKLKYEKTRY